jgi:biopolymer transport protein ExbD
MLRVLPPALLATTLLWVYFFAQPRGFLEYVVIPLSLPFLAIAIKRWLEARRNTSPPPLPKLAGDGPSRDPIRYLNVAATVVRIMLLFVLFGMFVGMHGTIIDYAYSIEPPLTKSPVRKPNAAREDAVIISVERDGKVYLQQQDAGNEQVSPDRLPSMLSDAIVRGSERRVYIKADRHVRYRMVKDVLAAVRSARIENVTFLVEQVKPTGPVDEIRNIFRP